MELKIERERKFLVRRLPKKYLRNASKEITQWYVWLKPPIRVRVEDFDDCYLTIKIKQVSASDEFRENQEYEREISSKLTGILQKVRKLNKIRKTRYLLGNLELDVFRAQLSGLVILEFEKKSEDGVFVLPPGFSVQEVTFDERFENHNLAKLDRISEEWRCEIV